MSAHVDAPLPDPHSWADFADPEAVAEALGAWDETADDERLRAEVIEERGREWWS